MAWIAETRAFPKSHADPSGDFFGRCDSRLSILSSKIAVRSDRSCRHGIYEAVDVK